MKTVVIKIKKTIKRAQTLLKDKVVIKIRKKMAIGFKI